MRFAKCVIPFLVAGVSVAVLASPATVYDQATAPVRLSNKSLDSAGSAPEATFEWEKHAESETECAVCGGDERGVCTCDPHPQPMVTLPESAV
ncbi:hypothetical protein PCASD_02106 [Puccinia coronata f. sp. avenae]|uniref:Secreted protein n=1 Tax=Puccinia coronata f. sp. avenae TaxID=200324 RepID=A0A2N5VQ19_9BASI|nr:hypothetical protein PCASD_02106 [Puccinia coronata f. sp. avenae]